MVHANQKGRPTEVDAMCASLHFPSKLVNDEAETVRMGMATDSIILEWQNTMTNTKLVYHLRCRSNGRYEFHIQTLPLS